MEPTARDLMARPCQGYQVAVAALSYRGAALAPGRTAGQPDGSRRMRQTVDRDRRTGEDFPFGSFLENVKGALETMFLVGGCWDEGSSGRRQADISQIDFEARL